MKSGSVKVIFDTNVWISFLFGRRLQKIKRLITEGRIIIVTTDQLLTEFRLVTKREKLRRYFPGEGVQELIELLDTISLNIEISPRHHLCRDPKDNFLLT